MNAEPWQDEEDQMKADWEGRQSEDYKNNTKDNDDKNKE